MTPQQTKEILEHCKRMQDILVSINRNFTTRETRIFSTLLKLECIIRGKEEQSPALIDALLTGDWDL